MSEFFCSSSHNLSRCQVDCCGKCKHIVECDSKYNSDISDITSSESESEKDSLSDQNLELI